MITSEQEKWLAHLPDGNSIEIHPYDPNLHWTNLASLNK